MEEQPIPIPMFNQDTFSVEINEHGMAEVYLWGDFKGIEHHVQFFKDLKKASNKCAIARVWISSPGGRLDTFLEMKTILESFSRIITVAASSANSAGAMVWAMGHIRVVAEHTTIMFHREAAFVGGKTDEIGDWILHNKKINEKLADELWGSILTESELERCRLTEVWKSGSTMIEEGHAISVTEMNKLEDASHIETAGSVLTNHITGEHALVTQSGQALPIIMVSGEEAEGHGCNVTEWIFGLKSAYESVPDDMAEAMGIDNKQPEESDEEMEKEPDARTWVKVTNVNLATFEQKGYVVEWIDGGDKGDYAKVFFPLLEHTYRLNTKNLESL